MDIVGNVDSAGNVPAVRRLQCVECGRDDERGWRAYLTTDEEEPAEVVVYCPRCDERELAAADSDERHLSAV